MNAEEGLTIRTYVRKIGDSADSVGLAGKLVLFNILFAFLPIFISSLTTVVLALYILKDRSTRRLIVQTPGAPFLAAWAVLSLVSGLLVKNTIGDAAFLLYLSFLIFGIYTFYHMTEELFRQILHLTAWLGIFAAVIAAVQRVGGFSDRPVSTFFNANYYGFMCEMMLLMSFYGLLKLKGGKRLFSVSIAANVAGILLSGCRSAWLATLGGAIVILLCLKNYKTVLTLVAGGVAGLAAIVIHPQFIPRESSLDTTTNLRIRVWKLAIEGFFQHPLIGRGFMGFWQISSGQGRADLPHAHNIILNALDSYGVIGFILVLCFAVPAIVRLIRKLRVQPCCALVIGVLAAILIHGMTDDTTLGMQTGIFTMIVLALAGVPAVKKTEEEDAPAAEPPAIQ